MSGISCLKIYLLSYIKIIARWFSSIVYDSDIMHNKATDNYQLKLKKIEFALLC